MDILFKKIGAILMDDAGTVFKDAFVGVTAGKISYIGQNAPEEPAVRIIDGAHKVLLPGFINTHTHTPMTILRGFADDLTLQEWLFDHIFPAEDKLTGEICRTAATVAIMEMLAGGTVSFSDMYFFVEDIAGAVAESGIKANLSRPLTYGDTPYRPENDTRLAQAEALRAGFHGYDQGRILVDASIHAEYTSSPEIWEACADFARKNKLGMHVHVSETRKEHEECIARHKMTPTAALCKHGLFDVPVTAAHCVHVTEEDRAILRDKGATAVHNPVSNLKLGSGVAPVPALLAEGVNVALGTDGAASNNNLDMLEEVKLAALLHGEPSRLGAAGALRLATRGGAKAQGRGGETGQIALGFDADLTVFDLDRPRTTPAYDLPSAICYAAQGGDVSLTMVRGRVLYENGSFPTIDREKILSQARRMSDIFRGGRS